MPRPVYVIPARIVSEDRTSNLVSISWVIERIELHRLQGDDDVQRQQVAAANIRVNLQSVSTSVVAVWMREDGDEEQVFEHEFVLIAPGVPNPQNIGPQPFQFATDASKHLQRFRLEIGGGFPTATESGIVEIQSRVRVADPQGDWITQSYPLVVDVVDQRPVQVEEATEQAGEVVEN